MNVNTKVGFTGARSGMTDEQARRVAHLLLEAQKVNPGPWEFHHGACIGADERAAMAAGNLGYMLIEYPSNLPHARTRLVSHETHTPKPPLERNHDIVDACHFLIAAPSGPSEVLRSGTWATVRYAREAGKRIVLVYPDGSFEVEKGGGK